MSEVQIFSNVGLNQNNVTGDPQGETASTGDNDKSLATTEFVQKVGPKYSNVLVANAAVIMDLTYIGKLVHLNGTSSYTITLPDNTTALIGSTITFACLTSYPITITSFSGQNIVDATGQSTSKILKKGDCVTLVKESTGLWLAFRTYATQFLANGMPAYVEPVGGKTISVDSFVVDFALSTGGTRNTYLQFCDDFSNSTTFGYPLPKNSTLKKVTIFARTIGSTTTIEIRTNGSTSPQVSYTIPPNTNQSHIEYDVSENFNAADVIGVYAAASSNFSHISVRMTFAWRD